MIDNAHRSDSAADASPPLWHTLLLCAAAGGMGWGIRGQYGHETGAGKTLRELSYETTEVPLTTGWALLFMAPLIVMLAAALMLAKRGLRGDDSQSFARWALLLSSWLYFLLNFGFFRTPTWPFGAATARTPSTIVFSMCVVALTLACLLVGQPMQRTARLARAV